MQWIFTGLVCLILGAGWSGSSASELVVAVPSDAETMDPGAHRDRQTETILRNIFDGLVARDDNLTPTAQLAQSWRIIDPTTYEFRLRGGVRFHDGTLLTADDVVYTFDRLLTQGGIKGKSSPRKSLLGPLQRVVKVDDRSVRFHLSEPWPMFINMLAFQEVVSRETLSASNADPLESKTNGTGPFELERWVRGRAVVLKRFAGYYGKSPQRPSASTTCLEHVVFRTIPNNDSRVAGLLAGDFHLITNVPSSSIPIIERHPQLEIREVNGTRSHFLALNLRAPPFNDPRVRRAIALAINREAIIEAHFLGRATLIDGILSPDAFGKNRSLHRYEHEIEAARELLREAGYEEGLRVNLNAYADSKDTASAIALQLASLGIDVDLDPIDQPTMRKTWLRGDPPPGAMLLTSWGNASLDPIGIFTPTHHSNGRGNTSGFSSTELDRLLDAAAVELDRGKRARLYQRAEFIANRELPYIYLWVKQDIYGLSKRLSNWQPRPDGRINLHDVCLEQEFR